MTDRRRPSVDRDARPRRPGRAGVLAALTLGALASAGLLLAAPAAAAAQNVILDEGTFTVYVGGDPAGSESFAIRRQGSGTEATLLANATVEIRRDGSVLRMRPYLKAGSDQAPLLYENAIEGEEVSRVMVSATGRHFVARIRSEAGERERELRAQDGSVFLDRDVAHHHYFVGVLANREGATVPVVVPRTGDQLRLRVEAVETETLQVGGETLQARRIRVSVNGDARTVWFDEQGRLLQVEIPSRDYRAVRQGL